MSDHHGVGEDPVEHSASAADRTGRAALTVVGVAVGLAYGTWAVSLPPFSGEATAAVLAAGSAAALLGAARPRRPERHLGQAEALWPWAALAAAVAAWQLAAYLQAPRSEHPTLSSLTNALLDSHPARAVAFAAWLLVAAAIARR